MKRYFVDTNVILRMLLRDAPTQYEQALSLFTQAKEGKVEIFVIPEIMFEIDFVLTKVYGVSKTTVIDYLKQIISTPYLHVYERVFLTEAVSLYDRLSVKFVDAYLLVAAKENHAEVFSFDREFRKPKTTPS